MRVVIAGAGVAGLEAMLALSQLSRDRVEVTLVSPTDEFVYRPMLVAEPFGGAEVLRLSLDRLIAEAGASHLQDSVVSVDPPHRTVATAGGAELPYDALLLALGANPVPVVPGALTFGGEEERARFATILGELGRRGTRRLAFVVPRAATWSIAAYELALLTAAERDARRLEGVELTLVTHEDSPLGLFGTSASQLVASRLRQAGIAVRPSSVAERFEDRRLLLTDGAAVPADAAVALPGLEVPPLPGIPQRRDGFIHADTAMQVVDLDHVWAAGDATWFPIKQGGLAAQQADVAARGIAARAGAHVPFEPWHPVLRAALITGDTPEFFRTSRGREPDAATVGRPLWWPPTKIAGRYLGPYLARPLEGHSGEQLADLPPAPDPDADRDRHQRAVTLVLSAADADARIGDFAGAISWLHLLEELNLVVPPKYVARRHEWRRQLDPAARDEAAERIDPSFASAAAALSDLQRRIGWLREIESRTEEEMGRDLAHLDDGLDHLIALSRRTGNLRRA